MEILHRPVRRRALRGGHRAPAVDQGHQWVELRPRHGPGRPPHRLGGGLRRHRQPGQGGVRAGRAVRQPGPRPPRGGRPADGRDCTREHHHARRGSWPSGTGRRHQGRRARSTSPCWPPTTARRVPTAATFTTNLAAAPPVQVSRDHLAATGGRASAVVVSSGNANAATGAAGRADAERHVRPGRRRGSAWPPEHVLVCSTGLIGIPLPMAADRRRASRRWSRPGPAGPDGRRRRRHRHPHHRLGPQGGAASSTPLHRGRHGQGGRHAGARHGHHAGLPHHRRRRRARARWPTSWASPSRRLVQLDDGRRLHLDQRHRGPHGLGTGRAGRSRTWWSTR